MTLLILSLVLMTYDVRASSRGFGGALRSGAQFLVSPIQSGVNAVVTPIVQYADGLANLAGLRAENERLRARIGELERDVVQVSRLETQVEELRVLLDLRLEGDLQELAVNAEVTGRGGTLDPALIIDRGTRDGVHAGQPVVDSRGSLVGVVSEAGDQVATVLPMTSRRAPAVSVRLPDGRRGVVEGQGAGSLALLIFDAEAPVDEGALLITYGPHGESDSYPKGLDVGRVAAPGSPRSGVIRTRVAPLADLDRVEYVSVIPWPPAPDRLEDGGEAPAVGVDGLDGTAEEVSP